MNKWCFLALFLFGIAQMKSSSLDLQQQFIVAVDRSEATISDCFKIASGPLGASVADYQFEKMLWGNTTLKWQFCARTSFQFDKWRKGIEASLKKTFAKKIQIKMYAQRPWIRWDYCSRCFAQAYQVVSQDGRHEIWIEYYKYEFLQGAITTKNYLPGGVIRVGALY
jgi:hypothetical protein